LTVDPFMTSVTTFPVDTAFTLFLHFSAHFQSRDFRKTSDARAVDFDNKAENLVRIRQPHSVPLYVRENVWWLIVQLPIDTRDLLTPPATFAVFGVHQLVLRPVEVIGNEGHLLVELLEGIAH